MQWQLSVPKSGDSAGKLPPEALRSVYRPLRSGVGIEVALFPQSPRFYSRPLLALTVEVHEGLGLEMSHFSVSCQCKWKSNNGRALG